MFPRKDFLPSKPLSLRIMNLHHPLHHPLLARLFRHLYLNSPHWTRQPGRLSELWIHLPGVPTLQKNSNLDAAYEEEIQWRLNIFSLPFWHPGSNFVKDTTRLLSSYVAGHPLEIVALKCVAVMTHLLLQQHFAKAKSREQARHLTRRLEMWHRGELQELLLRSKMIWPADSPNSCTTVRSMKLSS